MKAHYLDASAWVKRYFREAGSERIQQLFGGNSESQHEIETLGSSWLGYLEVSAAIARQSAARRISGATRRLIEAQLDYEWSRLLQPLITQEDFVSAADLARQYGLRGADALHLAIAREMNKGASAAGDDLVFWTADGELAEAGRKTGLQVQNPLDPVG